MQDARLLIFSVGANGHARAADHAGAMAAAASAAIPHRWLLGRHASLANLRPLTRLLYVLWHRYLGVPPRGVPTVRGVFDTRAEAVARCADEFDYLVKLPHGRAYGTDVEGVEGYCRPLDPAHAELNAREAEHYAAADQLHDMGRVVSRLSAALEAEQRQVGHKIAEIDARLRDLERGRPADGDLTANAAAFSGH